jgi:hypothetical protein
MKLLVTRRQRSRWLRWEWHRHVGVTYLNLTVGHPTRHCWWAFDAFLFLSSARRSGR